MTSKVTPYHLYVLSSVDVTLSIIFRGSGVLLVFTTASTPSYDFLWRKQFQELLLVSAADAILSFPV